MINTPLRILLTDDDEGDRLMFQEILEDMNIDTEVQTTKNGLELMEHLESNKESLPHLLFLDLNMPYKNGIACLKEIRNQKKYDGISIAIYSTSTAEKDIDITFQYGANIYITKPGDYGILKKVLAKAVFAVHQNQDTSFERSNFVFKI